MSDTIGLTIEKLVYGGDGMGFVEGIPVFVQMTVPGDEIECKITEKKKGYLRADLIKVITKSKNRNTPKCKYFGRCGGCQWQHIDYAAQILWKQLVVEEQLRRIGGFEEPNVLPAIPSPQIWNYRTRLRLHKDTKGRVGFFALGTHEVIEIDECMISEKSIEEHKKERLLNSEVPFEQVNSGQNANLKQLVKDTVVQKKIKNVLELYAGSGNITMSFSDSVNSVIAADSDQKGISLGVREAESLNVENVKFICMSAKAAVKHFVSEKTKFDCVIVDPPRDGCKDILNELIKIHPRHIIYVSCDPTTLARDLKILVENKYSLESTQPLDMFPQTYHIETVSVLSR